MLRSLFFLALMLIIGAEAIAQSAVGIGTTTPHASAALEVQSNNRGLLPPRMTAAQRNAIAAPAHGLIVFDIDSAALMLRTAGGWHRLTTTVTPGGFWGTNDGHIFNLNTGNVGIGVAAPSARLDVGGNMIIRGTGNPAAPPFIQFYQGNGNFVSSAIGVQNDSMFGVLTNAGWALNVNNNSGRVGIGTSTPQTPLQVANGNVVFGTNSNISAIFLPLEVSGNGRRLIWYNGRAAFRVGYAETEWDQDSIGIWSFATGFRTKALVNAAAAFGEQTTAGGFASTAFGTETTARGIASTAFGFRTTAGGVSSFSTGYLSQATNNDAASFNQLTIASGVGSFAAGTGTRAKGLSAAAFGRYNDDTDTPNPNATAPGDRIFQIGNGTADNARSNALTVLRNGNVGIGTTNPLARLHVTQGSVVFAAPSPLPPVAGNTPISGTGHRMMWYADKAAFRVGYVLNDSWDKDNIGYGSVALGGGNIASGNYSLALNGNTNALGGGSTAAGWHTNAKALYAFSLGGFTDDSDNPNPVVEAASDRLFQIGNGTVAQRRNAFTLLRNGNIGLGNVNNPVGRLHFANEVNNRILILNESVRNDHNYFGFGINNFTLRYQVADPNQSHVFFAGNAATATGSNELFRIKGNGHVGIGQSNPNAPLQFSNNTGNRKIVLYENANNDHQFYGFGINSGVLRYQTDAINADHVFYAAINSTSSTELMRIKGNGTVGFNTNEPQAWGHGGTNQLVEIRNRASGNDAQSHLILSTSGSGGSMGGVSWVSTALGGEPKAAFIGTVYETGNNNALVFYTRNINNFQERFRIRSDGSAWLQGGLTQFSDETLKKNIEPIADASVLLQQLHGYRYQWKDENADAEKQLGLLAQEVQKVLPELVKANEEGKLGVNYSGLIPVLLEALKEQQARIDKLEKTIEKLVRQ